MNSYDQPPSADVYAGDTSSPGAAATSRNIHAFTIEADAEPGTFARIANVLNIANTAPRRVSVRLLEKEAMLRIHVELAVSSSTAQSIQRKLGQLTEVIEVDLERISLVTYGF